MENKEVEEYFSGIMKNEPDVSAGIAAIRTLLKYLEHDNKSDTLQELIKNLKEAIKVMSSTDCPRTAINSGSELFLRFITLASLDRGSMGECKQIMFHRGEMFLKKLMQSRGKAAKYGAKFISDGYRILTHSKSRVVLQTLTQARKELNRRFQVYVTQCELDNSGEEMTRELQAADIPCTLLKGLAPGYIMESVDMVLVGAEGVVESGGIINKLGTYTIAICAEKMNKPFYVAAESFKFARLFPLNERDLANEFKYPSSLLGTDISKQHPLVDYTPPSLIALMFTDLGILTPSAVSDELIKLYL